MMHGQKNMRFLDVLDMQDRQDSCIGPHVLTTACCNSLLFSFSVMRLWKNVPI